MLKLIKVKDTLTHDQIHCDRQHFAHHIKGCQLRIIKEDPHYVLVEDSTGEYFTISKSMIASVDKEVSHG